MTQEILKDDVIINKKQEEDLQPKIEEVSELVNEMPENNEVIDPSTVKYKGLFPTKEEIQKEIEEALYHKNHIMNKYPNQRLEVGEKIKNPITELKSKFEASLKDFTD